MVSIKINDDLVADLINEMKQINPYDADKKPTHIVKDLITKEIIRLREINGKKKSNPA